AGNIHVVIPLWVFGRCYCQVVIASPGRKARMIVIGYCIGRLKGRIMQPVVRSSPGIRACPQPILGRGIEMSALVGPDGRLSRGISTTVACFLRADHSGSTTQLKCTECEACCSYA